MAVIQLLSRAGVVRANTAVDDRDLDRVSCHSWCLESTGYAAARIKGRKVYLHRFIFGATVGDGVLVDHINGDRLDNRRANLRALDLVSSTQNQRSNRGSTSRFRGVCFNQRLDRWVGQAKCEGKKFHGVFADELEAAKAVQAWRGENMPFSEPDSALVAVLDRLPAGSGKAAA